ncbi:MAG: GNAT family N-acetyltransferase [Pseudomonadota bacterium]
MTPPGPGEIFAALEASWPPQERVSCGPFVLRRDESTSQRTLAATQSAEHFTDSDIDTAETQMRAWGQTPLFQIRPEHGTLDTALAARGYQKADPSLLYLEVTSKLVGDLPSARAWPVWPPLACQREIWAQGGLDPGRIAVMERAAEPRVSILGRTGDSPAGATFLGALGSIAMLHAVEVDASMRRRGVARQMMVAAANWCAENGIDWLSLIVTEANRAAIAFYERAGFVRVGSYHYRKQ